MLIEDYWERLDWSVTQQSDMFLRSLSLLGLPWRFARSGKIQNFLMEISCIPNRSGATFTRVNGISFYFTATQGRFNHLLKGYSRWQCWY